MAESIKNKVLKSAEPYLEGLVVKDLVVGISLIAAQLDNGNVGVSYVLRYGLPPECSAFGYAQDVIGRSALEIAQWTVTGVDNLQKSIGNAVLAAASQNVAGIVDDTDKKCFFGMDITKEDTVGMIGLIKPVANTLSSMVKQLIVFDEGVSTYRENVLVSKMNEQPVLLPKCTKMIITGSSTINGSIDGLLEMCSNAEAISLVGSSTPMYPEAWKGTNVVALAGSWWKNEEKDEIFKKISLGGGISQLQRHMIKKIAFV